VGFVFGLVYYGLLLHWLLGFGLIAWLPLVVAESAYAGVFGLLAPRVTRAERPVASALALAALWTIVDWARGVWPLGGFTWGALAYTQHGNHLLLPLASVTGMWGIEFVMVAVNALALAALTRLRTQPLRSAALAVAAAVIVVLPVTISIPPATGRPLDVAVVQGNVPLSFASDRLLQTQAVAQNHIRLHERLASNPPQLAVWPENALPSDPTTDRVLGSQVSQAIRSIGAPTLVGAIARAPDNSYFATRFYNQVLLYSGEGRILGRYTKLHLVPGGEYVPWPRVFSWTNAYRRGNAELAPGHSIRLFTVDGLKVATPICFENVFPDLFRRFVDQGAGIVVLTTNDSSFLFDETSREHVIQSQIRAVENGRWVVQAAVSGESAVIDPTGVVRARTGLFVPAILRYEVPSSQAKTPYTRFGDWFAWLSGLVALAAVMLGFRRSRRARRPGAPSGSGSAPPAGEREPGRTPLPIGGGAEPRVLVALPTYNERETIAAVITGALAAGPHVEVLVVDDGSPDGTREVVQALAELEPRVRLVERSAKMGLASAYLTAFRRAVEEGYDLAVEMDADMSHRPDELPRLLEGSTRHDLTIGSRYVDGGAVTNWSKLRVGLSRAGNVYARTVLGLPVTDSTSGFRVYRRGLLEALVDDGIHSEGYAFQIELAYRAWRMGFSVGEVPITFSERQHGHSKLSRRIVIEAILKVTEWGLRDRILKRREAPARQERRQPQA
jgi:apolipoprotein N-acyltransferase